MPSIKIVKMINLKGIHGDLMDVAKQGVEAAVQESVSWIKNDVLIGQEYVGDTHFPDVTEATKIRKRKRGNTKVLILTGNYKDSFIGEVEGLVGVIRSGSRSYFGRLHKKWRIDKLWRDVHSKEALDIIRKSVGLAIERNKR